jgi:hypothetical protein
MNHHLRVAIMRAATARDFAAPPPVLVPEIVALPPSEPTAVPANSYRVPWFDERPAVTMAAVIKACTEAWGLQPGDIKSDRRLGPLIIPRQVAAHLGRQLTKHSIAEIGRRLGNRDHSTIHHALRKIARLLETDSDLAAKVDRIVARLQCRSEA